MATSDLKEHATTERGLDEFVSADKLLPPARREQDEQGEPIEEPEFISRDRADVIRRHFRSSRDQLTDDEIAYVFSEAFRTRLDPLRQLSAWRDKNGRVVVHTKIDGLLALAERTGHYRGAAPTILTWRVGNETVERPMRLGPPAGSDVQLIAATVAVHRDGFAVPVEVTRFWADMAPRNPSPDTSWDRMGSVMLEKVTFAAALRLAFPQDLAGLYEPSELEQADSSDTSIARR